MDASELAAHLRSWTGVPFVWGKTDCPVFTADWAEKATGNHFDVERAGVTDLRSVVRFYGSKDGFIRWADGVFAALQPRDGEAQNGDIVLFRHGPSVILGLVTQGRVAARSKNGIRLALLADLTVHRVWAIGEAAG